MFGFAKPQFHTRGVLAPVHSMLPISVWRENQHRAAILGYRDRNKINWVLAHRTHSIDSLELGGRVSSALSYENTSSKDWFKEDAILSRGVEATVKLGFADYLESALA